VSHSDLLIENALVAGQTGLETEITFCTRSHTKSSRGSPHEMHLLPEMKEAAVSAKC
jgi:hypothetical protein